jgi:hypothetical protein
MSDVGWSNYRHPRSGIRHPRAGYSLLATARARESDHKTIHYNCSLEIRQQSGEAIGFQLSAVSFENL